MSLLLTYVQSCGTFLHEFATSRPAGSPPPFFAPFVFTNIQTAFPASRVFSKPSKLLPGVTHRSPRSSRSDFRFSSKARPFNSLPPLTPLFAQNRALVPFLFNSLQPLFAKQGGGVPPQASFRCSWRRDARANDAGGRCDLCCGCAGAEWRGTGGKRCSIPAESCGFKRTSISRRERVRFRW